MKFDLQARLAQQRVNPTASTAWDLVGQLSDECLSWACKGSKNQTKARRRYQQRASQPTLALPDELRLSGIPTHLFPSWVSIKITFELKTPWYSKDDRPLHVLDNPVRKDRVFGVPFMAASSWKGLLRWSCRMDEGLLDHLDKHDGKLDDWDEPSWIVHLFGNTRGEVDDFSQGALHCFPTWFDKIGFEVINPHDRARRAGTQPIYYEVVPPGRTARLQLLYAPGPGQAQRQRVDAVDALPRLFDATNKLLTVYGFSAKRTAGWGLAEIRDGEVRSKRASRTGGIEDLKASLPQLVGAAGGPE